MTIDLLEWGALALTAAFFAVLYYLDRKKHVDFGVLTLIATALGIVVGVAFKGHYQYVGAFGTVYAHVITALVVPLLLFSIVSSITNLSASIRLGQIGGKTVFFLLLNTATAAVMTLLVATALNVGAGFAYDTAGAKTAEVPGFLDTLIGLFPQNLAAQWSEGQVVPLVVFAILVGAAYNALARRGEDVKPFKAFVDAGNKVMGEVIGWVIGFTPYAVLALIARAVSRSSLQELTPLLGVLVLVYVLAAVQTFGVGSLLLRLVGRLSPLPFFRGIWPAGVVAFTSQSSIGTIPVTVESLSKRVGVNEDVAAFTASLGANLGMPGCAGIWPVLTAVFAIHATGLPYTAAQYAFLVVLALVVSVGTVGVPGTATITATALFTAAGLPVELIVLLAPISTIADMARTAANVVGAATAATLVAKTEGLLDEKVYYAKDKAGQA